MEEYKNLQEIIELCEEELNNNDENVTATLDLTDLKELRNLINRNKELEECLEVISKALNNIAYDQIPIAIEDLKLSSIPKSKVKEKIKELEQIRSTALTGRTMEMMDDKINILELILEE